MSEWEKGPEDVIRHNLQAGYFETLDYPNAIFVTHIQANRRGDGVKVMRALIEYGEKEGKPIWGEINQRGEGMDNDRLKRWYERMGGVVVGRLNGNNLVQQRYRR